MFGQEKKDKEAAAEKKASVGDLTRVEGCRVSAWFGRHNPGLGFRGSGFLSWGCW